jgi:hypothetical protein
MALTAGQPALSCRPNQWDESDLLRHRPLSSWLVNALVLVAARARATGDEKSGAPCSPPRSATGVGWLRSCSARTVAAHVSIEVTGHHHRQSSVDRHRKVCGHRQDNVRPVVLGLHQSSSAAAELHCSVDGRRDDGPQHRRCRSPAHAWAPSSLPSFMAARAWRSLALAAALPT